MLDLKTVNDIFFMIASSDRERAILWQDERDQWQPISSAQLYQRVRALAQAFLAWGIKKGDRIALLAENRWEWSVADFAVLAIGAADVPIYPTLTAEQIAELLIDSNSRIIVVSTRKQYDKVASIAHRTKVEHVVLMDEERTPDAVLFSSLIKDADAAGKQRDPAFDRVAYDVQPSDLATIIYTSGTTGEPKGVMLTHGNIGSNVSLSTDNFGFGKNESWISFLPLSHITARHLDYALACRNGTVAYCSNFENLPSAMTTIKPTVFVAVPRVYEKIRQEVERRAALSPVKSRLLAWSLSTGKRHRDTLLAGNEPSSLLWKLASKTHLQQGPSGIRRTRQLLRIRWRPTRPGHSALVCRRRHSHPRGLRPYRNIAPHRRQRAAGIPHRISRQDPAQPGVQSCSRWGTARPRAVHL